MIETIEEISVLKKIDTGTNKKINIRKPPKRKNFKKKYFKKKIK